MLKQFHYQMVYRGQQILVSVAAPTKKKATEIFGITAYEARNFMLDGGDLKKECKENPGKVYGYFDSGLLFREHKELNRKYMEFEELTKLIDKLKD